MCVGIELDKLDAEMIKILAWQRIQQLFPPKVPNTPAPLATAAAPKSPSPRPDSETLTQPLTLLFSSVFHCISCWLGCMCSHCQNECEWIWIGLSSLSGQKKVQARAVFYPLTGKGGAINMCYRTLYIGSGKTCWLYHSVWKTFTQLEFGAHWIVCA